MWKHVVASSIQSAFIGAILLILVCLPAYGGAATIFGFVAFPIAFTMCLLSAYPLIRLWQIHSWSNRQGLLVYIATGFILGFFTPVILFGLSVELFSFQSIVFLSVYGSMGVVCSISAWRYVSRNVAL